jgi:enoyl-CoA hydratase/carnithine racemase
LERGEPHKLAKEAAVLQADERAVAEEAEQLGLVSRVIAAQDFAEETGKLLAQLAALSASALAPGDYCSVSDLYLNDGGNLPGNVYSEITSATGSGCDVMYFFDTFGVEQLGVSNGPLGIAPSSPIGYSATLGLNSGLDNSYQGVGCTFTVTFSATAF